MVSGRSIFVAEDRIVEQVRQRRHGPVQAALADRPPVGVVEDQVDVVAGRRVNPRVLEDERFVVEGEPGAKGVGVREEGDGDEDWNGGQSASR